MAGECADISPYAYEDRPELSALGTAVRIYDEKVRLARAEYMPTVALTGGYFASYPSVFNSFEKKFKGTWNIGVAVNLPIQTWGDRTYKVKAAKAEADENLRYATLGMKEGVIPVSNVIETQTAWLAAKTNILSADIDLRLAYVLSEKSDRNYLTK